jgi:PKD repeat protein
MERIIDCAPFDLTIDNSSLNADQYNWTYGDGAVFNTNSSDPVNHIYDNQTNEIAAYDLKLVSSSTFGCVDSINQKIYVYPRTEADFIFNDEGCSPLEVNFVNQSIRGDSYLWEFGDGSTMSSTDPVNIYFNFTGADVIYPVTLTSISEFGCTSSKTDSVYVYPQPDAEFSASPSHQEFPSSTVDLTNLSNIGNWSYVWDYGDGSTSSLEYPVPHTYSTWGNYEITLYLSSTNCSDSISHNIRIFPAAPLAEFDTIIPGCAPLTIEFYNRSQYGITFLWEFDDGNYSSDISPTHTYTEEGFYNVKLTVEGEGGIDYAYQQVEVFRRPLVDFRVAPDLVMLPDQEIQLFNLSEYGEFYLWDFGDGSTSIEENPSHLYTDVGTYSISLDVWTIHNCTDRLDKPDAVTVEAEGMILFPNAFKPDMTGPNGGRYELRAVEKNNIFHPLWEGVEKYELLIYNRWGELLYTSNDVMVGWDGYHYGRLASQGVYIWKCVGNFVNGQSFNLAGDVTLLHDSRGN